MPNIKGGDVYCSTWMREDEVCMQGLGGGGNGEKSVKGYKPIVM